MTMNSAGFEVQELAIPLQNVMHQPVVVLQLFDTVADALETARERGVHHFPVCRRDHVMGMLCTCDLRDAPLSRVVGEIMRPAVTLPMQRSAWEAAALMRAADVGSILVTDDTGAVSGIVTRSDLSREPSASPLLQDCRCEVCGSIRHLQRYEDRQLCSSCKLRATEPWNYDTGGGD